MTYDACYGLDRWKRPASALALVAASMTHEHEEWRRIRLPNWGRAIYAGLMETAPDSSCANPIYQNFIWHEGRDGDGEVTEATVIVTQTTAARAELPPIDEDDAEVVGAWIAQLGRGHRETLSQRYVLRRKVDPNLVDQAITAILHLVRANREVVRRMHERA